MNGMMLTRHENQRFESQTIYASGNGYLNCTFSRCTLVFTNVAGVMNGCTFENCNFHIDYLVLWGDPEGAEFLRTIVKLLDGGSLPWNYSTS